MTQQTLPDQRVIGFAYDPNGNLTSVTPPGRPAHTFNYTPVNLQSTYTPPASGGGATQYTYNHDRQLTLMTRGDGSTIGFSYDGAGRRCAPLSVIASASWLLRVALPLFAVVALGLAAAGSTSARHAASAGARLVWVAAHSDDEIFAAPLLGELCVERRYRCTFIVFTRGERGACRGDARCADLPARREKELRRSAGIFGADLLQWSYADGSELDPRDVVRQWGKRGRCAGLLDDLRAATDGAAIVLTFDPIHGVSDHPDHRAVADLVQTAIAGMERPPLLYSIVNRAEVGRGGSDIEFEPSPLPAAGSLVSNRASWKYVLAVARVHSSQFDAEALQRFGTMPEDSRVIVAVPTKAGERVPCRR